MFLKIVFFKWKQNYRAADTHTNNDNTNVIKMRPNYKHRINGRQRKHRKINKLFLKTIGRKYRLKIKTHLNKVMTICVWCIKYNFGNFKSASSGFKLISY